MELQLWLPFVSWAKARERIRPSTSSASLSATLKAILKKKQNRIFFLDVKSSRGLTLRMQTPRMCYFNLYPISYSDPEGNHDSEIWEKTAPPWCSFFKQVTGNWPFSNIIYSSCSSQPGPTDGWRVALELRHHWFFYIYNPRTADSR